jgi:hypothetical protein
MEFKIEELEDVSPKHPPPGPCGFSVMALMN